MYEFQHVMSDRLGLHAKTAGAFAELVKSLDAAVTVSKAGQTVSGDQLLGLVSLDAKKGDTITVALEDASEEDIRKIEKFVKEKF